MILNDVSFIVDNYKLLVDFHVRYGLGAIRIWRVSSNLEFSDRS